MKTIKLTDVISVEALQQIQDGFSRYTGMAALTTDSDGVPVTRGSGFTRFCMELTRQSKEGCRHCEECDKNGALLTLKNGHATVYDCHAGLVDFAAPIMVEGMFLGSFIGGQVRTEEVDEAKMRQTAMQYNIDADDYIAAARDTKCIAKEDVLKTARFLEEIAAGLSGMAYNNYLALQESLRMEQAAVSQADFVINLSMNLERSMNHWSKIIENTMSKTKETEVRELLAAMQKDGEDVRSGIRDTVDYICLSANKIELMETDYTVKKLAKQLMDGISKISGDMNIPVNLTIGECSESDLFGDVGRIGQLLNKMLRTILEKKSEGELEVQISTEKCAYATMLNVIINDRNTGYTSEDVEELKERFECNDRQGFFVEGESNIRHSLEGVLLAKMAGTISFDIIKQDMIVRIGLPQLALEGGN